jgi:ABC-type Fe3+ transport system substrate-binding protein
VSYQYDRGLVLTEDMMNRPYRKPVLLLVSTIFFFSIGFPPGSAAQDSHTRKLIEGAKKEASLIWYTSTSIEDIKRLFDAFTKKYPFIKTEFFNAGSPRVFNRILNEARTGQSLIAQLMAAGEFPMAMVLAHRMEKMKEQGAPVEWVTTLDPITVSLHPIGVGAKAPDSNAAKLFIDFVLSKVGQQVVLAMGRTPSRPGIDTKMQSKNLKLFPIPPELGEHYNQYQKEFREHFR